MTPATSSRIRGAADLFTENYGPWDARRPLRGQPAGNLAPLLAERTTHHSA